MEDDNIQNPHDIFVKKKWVLVKKLSKYNKYFHSLLNQIT